MKLVSLNCGLPREVEWHGRTVTTGIFMEPVGGRVALRRLNLGDRQADLTVHGGEAKAVYCYPFGPLRILEGRVARSYLINGNTWRELYDGRTIGNQCIPG